MARIKKDKAGEKISLIKKVIEDKKGSDIVVLDMKNYSFTDYFIIASGSSEVQLNAIADEITDKLKEKGRILHHREGKVGARWILLDAGDIVIHLFHEHLRKYYNLERLWYEAKKS